MVVWCVIWIWHALFHINGKYLLRILLPYNYIQMPQDVNIGIQMNKVPHVVIVVLHGYEEKVV